MRDVPAFVLSVILGGIILFFLLWIWFWFEQGGPSRMQSQSGYPSDDDQGYSPRYQNNYDNRYGRYGGDSRYAGYGNGYGYDQGQPAYPPRRFRRPTGCGNPCY